MIRHTITINQSQANYSIKTTKGKCSPEKNKQVSYNIGVAFYENLLKHDFVELRTSDYSFLSEHHEFYVLKEDVELVFSETIRELLLSHGISHEELEASTFLVSLSNHKNSKPQLMRTHYKKLTENKYKSYEWFWILYDNNVEKSKVCFNMDTDKRILYIDLIYPLAMENTEESNKIKESRVYNAHQLIVSGVPGSGKSYYLKQRLKRVQADSDYIIKTVAHPEYSYYDFIGSILPSISPDNKVIYEFLPGPFSVALKKAIDNPRQSVFLVIEEMNRGNVASYFGDVFQLLDRSENGESEHGIYNINISRWLHQTGSDHNKEDKIYLPSNLSIVGTINNSDQNLYVMDTAFKRRFDFHYMSTKPQKDNKGNVINQFKFSLREQGKKLEINWIDFYQTINSYIINDLMLPEDKQLGQFFIEYQNSPEFEKLFKTKLIQYLWYDVHLVARKKTLFKYPNNFEKNYYEFLDGNNIFGERILDSLIAIGQEEHQ